jgi:hypothetical protein
VNKLLTLLKNYKLWLGLQALALGWGNYVGWSTIYRDVQVFCTNEAKGLDALLSFNGTVTTNPLTTPCFWGTLAFAVALIWTVRLLFMKDLKKVKHEYKKLFILLVVGTIFALVNNVPLFYKFYTTPKGTATSCSPGKLLTNPFITSCFFGLSAFSLSVLSGLGVRKTLRE